MPIDKKKEIDYENIIKTSMNNFRRAGRRASYILVTPKVFHEHIQHLDGYAPCYENMNVISSDTIYGLSIALLTGYENQPMVIM